MHIDVKWHDSKSVTSTLTFEEGNSDTFCWLQHDIGSELREFVLPALDLLVCLENSHDYISHLRQGELLSDTYPGPAYSEC